MYYKKFQSASNPEKHTPPENIRIYITYEGQIRDPAHGLEMPYYSLNHLNSRRHSTQCWTEAEI
jgi:hypothetical protein